MYYIYVQICLAAGTEAMGKYSALGDYLRAQTRSEVPMTFAQIERVIGAKLPTPSPKPSGFSDAADIGTPLARGAGPASSRHPLFGLLQGLMRIPPGADLTQPADPEWGKDV